MQYIDFLQNVASYIKNTTVSGVAQSWFVDIVLEDEIELKTGTTYPAVFIVPIPFDMSEDMMAKYSCKIYMVDSVTRAPNYNLNRINTYNRMISYCQAFLQQLPDEYINDFPITINPIVKWDANVDGIYFDFILNNAISCIA